MSEGSESDLNSAFGPDTNSAFGPDTNSAFGPEFSSTFEPETNSDLGSELKSDLNSDSERKCGPANFECKNGLLLPAWQPQGEICIGERVIRAMVYLFVLAYLFVGVSIIADLFMAAIEVITSQEREFKIKRSNGKTAVILVRVWNHVVADLTLIVLGSSAPEILLSVIEVVQRNFQAGELGPGAIVGSAAFNLYFIFAICILVIPNGETRKIKHIDVFWSKKIE